MNIDDIIYLPPDQFAAEVDKLYETYLNGMRSEQELIFLRLIIDKVEGKERKTHIFNVLHKEQQRQAEQGTARKRRPGH